MLETDRLWLRRLDADDTDAIFEMRRDPEIMRFIRDPQVTRKESVNWIRLISEKWPSEKIGFCGLFEKRTGRFAGWCGLWRLIETNEIEVGYAVARNLWGMGYATEAATKMLEYGFETLGLEKIVAVAFPENQASQNVMKKLGMTYVRTGTFYKKTLVQYSIECGVWQKIHEKM